MYGIKTLHILTKVKPPDLGDIEMSLTLRGLKKTLIRTVKRAQPLTPDILMDILAHINLSKQTDLIFWVLLLVSFFGMLCKSNLVPDTRISFDGEKQLTRGHITFRGDVAIVTVTWAKNIQNRQKIVELPLFSVPGSPLCPITTLRAILANKGKKHYPLFGTGKILAFSYYTFQAKLRRVLKKAGYRAHVFSSHSMRCGGAVWAHRSGVPDSLIQTHGVWASDVYKAYLEYPLEVRAIVSLKMRERILKTQL